MLVENWLGDTFVDGDFRPIPLASGMCGLRVSQLPRYAGLVRAFGIRHRVGNVFYIFEFGFIFGFGFLFGFGFGFGFVFGFGFDLDLDVGLILVWDA